MDHPLSEGVDVLITNEPVALYHPRLTPISRCPTIHSRASCSLAKSGTDGSSWGATQAC